MYSFHTQGHSLLQLALYNQSATPPLPPPPPCSHPPPPPSLLPLPAATPLPQIEVPVSQQSIRCVLLLPAKTVLPPNYNDSNICAVQTLITVVVMLNNCGCHMQKRSSPEMLASEGPWRRTSRSSSCPPPMPSLQKFFD